MNKIISKITIISIIVISNLYSVQNIQYSNVYNNKKSDIQQNSSSVITGNSIDTIMSSINEKIANYSKKEELLKLMPKYIEGITAKEFYKINKNNKNKTKKELKTLIKSSSEMKIVDYFNGKTLEQIYSDRNNIIDMKKKYTDLYILDIKKNIISKSDINILNSYIVAYTDDELLIYINNIYENIENEKLLSIVKEAFQIIIDNNINHSDLYELFLDKSVKEIIEEAINLDNQFKDKIKSSIIK